MFLTFYGAADTVTGSCFVLDTGYCRIMVDCGLFQGSKTIRQRNYDPFPFPPRSIDYLLLTHAHLDHSGLIPKLVKHGYNGPIITTRCTVDLCAALLPDSAYVQETEVENKNRKARRAGRPLIQPIYTVDDALAAMRLFQGVGYDEEVQLCKGVRARFRDAGHILGSALIELWVQDGNQETKFVFSGDLGNYGRPFVEDPTEIWEADCLLLESTYGDRLHNPEGLDPKAQLRDVIQRTYKRGGNVLIPAFAVERTQELIYDLSLLYRAGELPPVQIYVDSPLAAAVTKVFTNHHECYDAETRELVAAGAAPLEMPNLRFSQSVEESRMLNATPSGLVIIAGSGMCDAGRIRHHLKHNLWRPESSVVFVGYQAEGTLGRRLLDGEKDVRIFGEDICVRAEIVNIEGFSAHADQRMLVDWLKKFSVLPQQLFLVHGEPSAARALQDRIVKDIGLLGVIPRWQETVAIRGGRHVQDKVRQACAGFWARLENFLEQNPDRAVYDEVMSRLNELQQFIEEKAGGKGVA